ncbi:cytochrome P450 [Mycena vulgaris]|nr:cytochrome P450 [Mycena vulgaris]
MSPQILIPIPVTVLCYLLLFTVQFLYRELTYPLRHLSGPQNPSFIFGNFRKLAKTCLHTSDLKALNHISFNSSVYQRPPFVNRNRETMIGSGLLTVDPGNHHRQRRILNQAFGTHRIGLLTETFIQKAVQLREIWASQLAQNTGAATRIDVYSWLRRMTLDIIGQAGFNYDFNALEETEKPNELNQAFTELLHSPNSQRNVMFRIVAGIVPALNYVRQCANQDVLCRSIRASDGAKSFGVKKDLLSVLLKANLSKDIPESQRLSDTEVVSQIPAFFVAGHETTSTATAWALHALSLNPNVQAKLREELFTISSQNPTMNQLNSLPYLDSVVREVLRVYSPVTFVDRMAMQDDVLPLSKPYIDKTGKSHDTLLIPKGQIIRLPILIIHMDPETWGDDAAEFRPERWEHVPDASSAVPSVWGNLFTFFAGPNNCIGFRFALVELKALLFTLVRAFEYEPAFPKGGIGCTSSGLQSPVVVGEREKGTVLPMLLKLYNA